MRIPNHGPGIRVRLFAASLLLMVLTTTLFAQSVGVNSVDNYAGNSNVSTNAPNTEVKVTELDADGKPVRSWTGRTDANGKITLPAGSNLSKPYIRVTRVSDLKMAEGAEQGFIVPDAIPANSPLLFTASGSAEGQVVSIQTENGEVVGRPRTDEKGRIFLAAGLAAGLYNLVMDNGGKRQTKPIQVKPSPPDALVRPGQVPTIPMKLDAIPNLVKASEPLRLTGQGINPDPKSLQMYFKSAASAGQTSNAGFPIPQWLQDLLDGKYLIRQVDVLAATSDSIVLAPLAKSGISPGTTGSIVGSDHAWGKAVETRPVYVYDARSRLIRTKIRGGEATSMLVDILPGDLNGEVEATIGSGPVKFANGQRSMTAPVQNGRAEFPIHSDAGSKGRFSVDWSFTLPELATPLLSLSQDPKPGSRKRGHTIGQPGGGWTDEYTDYDADGNRIGGSSETYDANGVMREKTTDRTKEGNGTKTTETFDDKGKWKETKSENFKDGKSTGGTTTTPDGKGGTKTEKFGPPK